MGNDLTFPDIAKKCANVSAKFIFAKIVQFSTRLLSVKIFWQAKGNIPSVRLLVKRVHGEKQDSDSDRQTVQVQPPPAIRERWIEVKGILMIIPLIHQGPLPHRSPVVFRQTFLLLAIKVFIIVDQRNLWTILIPCWGHRGWNALILSPTNAISDD